MSTKGRHRGSRGPRPRGSTDARFARVFVAEKHEDGRAKVRLMRDYEEGPEIVDEEVIG